MSQEGWIFAGPARLRCLQASGHERIIGWAGLRWRPMELVVVRLRLEAYNVLYRSLPCKCVLLPRRTTASQTVFGVRSRGVHATKCLCGWGLRCGPYDLMHHTWPRHSRNTDAQVLKRNLVWDQLGPSKTTIP